MKKQRSIKALPVFSVLILLAILFQNCGPAKISAEMQDAGVLNSTQNPNVTPTPSGATPTPPPLPPSLPTPTPPPLPTPTPTPFSFEGLIVAEPSDLCLDVDGGFLSDGTSIGTWGCEVGSARQNFVMRPSGGGYTLRPTHSGSCLSVQDSGFISGTLIVQDICLSFPGQIWNYQDLGNRRFKLVDRNSGRCLTAPDQLFNGSLHQLYIATCNSANTYQNFRWR